MAARLPQSSTSVAYRIKPAYASKVLAVFWPAGADSIHRLRSADTSSTIVTRAASGATFDATTGFIRGNSTTYFTDSLAGGYVGSTEQDNYTLGVSYFGDLFNAIANTVGISTGTPPDQFDNAAKLRFNAYTPEAAVAGRPPTGVGSSASDVDKFIGFALRNNQADATAKQRFWFNGAENTSIRGAIVPTATAVLGGTSNPLYLGGTAVGTGNTYIAFELVWIGTGAMTDADLVAITADPSIMIESSAAGTVPGAPTIGTATAGNASASVTITAGTAGSTATTSYVATSTPGGFTGTAAASPITVSGLANGTAYTFTVHATNSVGNSAESAASNSVTPTATVTVTSVTVSPSTATVAGGGTQTFTATVAGTGSPAQTVTWSTNLGTITAGGVYTAPATTASAQTATITATSTVDATKSGTATATTPATGVTVTSVTVSPSTATVAGGATQTFTAAVAGTGSPAQTVTWTTNLGSITSGGVYTAPATTAAIQTATITATSTVDNTKSGTATATTPAAASGTLTTSPLKNNAGTLLVSLTGITAMVYDLTTGALVVKKTAQTTNASGVLVVIDATIVTGTQYRLVIILATAAEGMDKVTAT